MSGSSKEISKLFADLVEMRYSEFRILETRAVDVTNRGDILVKLARATRQKKGGLRAIREVLDRMDGKVAAKVEYIFPKMYARYPNAISVEGGEHAVVEEKEPEVVNNDLPALPEVEPWGSIRYVVEKMLDRTKAERLAILMAADEIDENGVSEFGNPKLKSVIAASLYELTNHSMGSLYELLEQIEGKVADKIEVEGEDTYILRFDKVAPAGSVKSADGVYEILLEDTTNFWAKRLSDDLRVR